MASSYTDLLRLEKPAAGEQQGSWGTTVNNNIELLEDAISGITSISTTGGGTTLTTNDASDDQARKAVLLISGTLVSAASIVIPNSTKVYIVRNGCTVGAFTVTVKTSGGSGIVIAEGETTAIVCDGNDNIYRITLSIDQILGGTLGEIVSALTQDTSPNREADVVGTYDDSAALGKKVLLRDVAGEAVLEHNTFTSVASKVWDLSAYTAYKWFRLRVFATIDVTLSYIDLDMSIDGGLTS